MTDQSNYVVQPLGKYGHAYLLNKDKYIFYRVLYAALYLALSIMFVLVVAPESFRASYGISSNQIVIDGALVVTFGMAALIKIASTGRIVSGQTEKRRPEIYFMWNVHYIIGLACGIVFMLLIGFILLTQIFLQHTIDPSMAFLFLVFSGMTLVIWNKKARNKNDNK